MADPITCSVSRFNSRCGLQPLIDKMSAERSIWLLQRGCVDCGLVQLITLYFIPPLLPHFLLLFCLWLTFFFSHIWCWTVSNNDMLQSEIPSRWIGLTFLVERGIFLLCSFGCLADCKVGHLRNEVHSTVALAVRQFGEEPKRRRWRCQCLYSVYKVAVDCRRRTNCERSLDSFPLVVFRKINKGDSSCCRCCP